VRFREVFRRTAGRNPERTFMFCDGDSITYAEANQHSDAIAASLIEAGLVAGDRVDLVMTNSIDAVLLCVACWKGGLLPVMIDPRSAPDDLEYYCAFAGPALLVYDDELEDKRPRSVDVPYRSPRRWSHAELATLRAGAGRDIQGRPGRRAGRQPVLHHWYHGSPEGALCCHMAR
jgi:acyl-CoA synthetase (AMP-forming)/AMP-acid ligase II